MAKEKFSAASACEVGTIGHVDHGKTTLTAAITKIMAAQFAASTRPTTRSTRRRKRRPAASPSRRRMSNTNRRSGTMPMSTVQGMLTTSRT